MAHATLPTKVVGILVREEQEDVLPLAGELSERATALVRSFQALAASATSGLNTRCVAVACVFLACEEKQVATKYDRWRLLAGCSSAVSFHGAVRTVRNALRVYLKLSKLCIAL